MKRRKKDDMFPPPGTLHHHPYPHTHRCNTHSERPRSLPTAVHLTPPSSVHPCVLTGQTHTHAHVHMYTCTRAHTHVHTTRRRWWTSWSARSSTRRAAGCSPRLRCAPLPLLSLSCLSATYARALLNTACSPRGCTILGCCTEGTSCAVSSPAVVVRNRHALARPATATQARRLAMHTRQALCIITVSPSCAPSLPCRVARCPAPRRTPTSPPPPPPPCLVA